MSSNDIKDPCHPQREVVGSSEFADQRLSKDVSGHFVDPWDNGSPKAGPTPFLWLKKVKK